MVVLVLRRFVPHRVFHDRFVDIALFGLAWCFLLLTPVLGALTLTLGRDQRGLRLSGILQLALWGIAVIFAVAYPLFACLAAAPMTGGAATGAPPALRSGVVPGAVFVYAWVPTLDPVPLADGRDALIAAFDQAPSSYVQLDGFEASEESRFPGTFDATVVIVNDSEEPPGRVEISVSVLARVGPFVEDPTTGMTDYRRGQAEAAWQKKPLLQKHGTVQLDTRKRYYAPKVEGFTLRQVVDRLAASDKWPFELEVVAELRCGRCEKGRSVTRRLSVVPGD